jgi:hypothetical protein
LHFKLIVVPFNTVPFRLILWCGEALQKQKKLIACCSRPDPRFFLIGDYLRVKKARTVFQNPHTDVHFLFSSKYIIEFEALM